MIDFNQDLRKVSSKKIFDACVLKIYDSLPVQFLLDRLEVRRKTNQISTTKAEAASAFL